MSIKEIQTTISDPVVKDEGQLPIQVRIRFDPFEEEAVDALIYKIRELIDAQFRDGQTRSPDFYASASIIRHRC